MLVRKSLSLSDCDIKMQGDTGRFSGYASVFGGVDSRGDTIVKGAFAHTLATHGQPKMFYGHQVFDGLPIGKWHAEEDDHGLHVEGEVTPGLSLANDVRAALKHGTLDGLSIGGYLQRGDYEMSESGDRRTIKRWSKLVEVSIVAFPADAAARVDLATVKSDIDHIDTIREFERFLRDAGGLTKGAAEALAARAKIVFSRGEPGENVIDAKAAGELQAVMHRLKARIPL